LRIIERLVALFLTLTTFGSLILIIKGLGFSIDSTLKISDFLSVITAIAASSIAYYSFKTATASLTYTKALNNPIVTQYKNFPASEDKFVWCISNKGGGPAHLSKMQITVNETNYDMQNADTLGALKSFFDINFPDATPYWNLFGPNSVIASSENIVLLTLDWSTQSDDLKVEYCNKAIMLLGNAKIDGTYTNHLKIEHKNIE